MSLNALLSLAGPAPTKGVISQDKGSCRSRGDTSRQRTSGSGPRFPPPGLFWGPMIVHKRSPLYDIIELKQDDCQENAKSCRLISKKRWIFAKLKLRFCGFLWKNDVSMRRLQKGKRVMLFRGDRQSGAFLKRKQKDAHDRFIEPFVASRSIKRCVNII